MIKRMVSVLLAVMMVMSVATISAINFNAVEIEKESNKIYFDAQKSGWKVTSKSKIGFYIYSLENGEDDTIAWGSKKLNGTAVNDADGNFTGVFSYDPAAKGMNLKDGEQYAIIFTFGSTQTYDLMMDTTCLGNIAYADPENQIENPVDSSKTVIPAYWEDLDAAKYGPRIQITSTGNVVGSCYPAGETGENIFTSFLTTTDKQGIGNARQYSTKSEQQMIDDIGTALGLNKDFVKSAFEENSVTTTWSYETSTLPGEVIPVHIHTPGESVQENVVPATCETEGSYDEIVYCTECGEEISRELKTIDKLDHDIRYAEEVPATRTVDGMKAHFECTRCHKYFADSMGHIEISAETLIIKAEHLRGDANTDGVLDITDVTTIQRVLAEHSVWSYDEVAADADLDGIVDIIDAVLLSRILAVMTTFERWDNSYMLANTGIAHDRLYETNSSDKTISSVGDSQTAIISIYGFNGQYETKSIKVGDTFDVYTYLNASDLVDKGKIAGIDAYQMYTDSTLSLNSTIYPIFNDNIVYNVDNIGKILYNALTPEIDYPFIFNSNDDVVIQTTYTVKAPGQGEVRNAIKTLAAADEDITPIIKNGEIANNSVINVEVSFDKREHIHVPSSVVKENVIPATCKFEGTYDEVVYCTECGEEISRSTKTIPFADHSLQYIPEVKPTYDTAGIKEHYQCTACGKRFSDSTGYIEVTDDDLHIPLVEMKIGDINKDYEITVMDTTFIQFYLSYQRSLNGGEYEPVEKGSRDFTVADVDGDGRISIFDALRIQRYCAKMCKLDGSPYDD